MAEPQILTALRAALAARGFSDMEPQLAPIEPPRDWGVTTNVCFALAGRVAAPLIEQATAGLDKKAAKDAASRITREAGPKLAAELAEELAGANGKLVTRVEAEGAYLNFYYDPAKLGAQVVTEALQPRYGAGAPTGKRIMVEYAQPNTHKDFHVGHLRNASIGQAIANLLEFEGNEVLKATYIGDVGAHVMKAYFGFMHGQDPNFSMHFEEANKLRSSGNELAYIDASYRGANRAIEIENYPIDQRSMGTEGYPKITPRDLFPHARSAEPEAMDEPFIETGRAWIAKAQIQSYLQDWEDEDRPGHTAIREWWTNTRQLYLDYFNAIFSELNIVFSSDCWFCESVVDDLRLGQQTAEELKQRGIAVVDISEEYKGALYVDFEQQADSPVFRDDERKRIRKLGKMTILRSDGTSLYQTKELGLAKYKFDNFQIDESLYVVGSEQRLYFEQVFAILRLWGFPNAENCRHIAYELVVLPEGKMSSREGTVVSYRELRDEAVRRAQEITREKGIVAPGQDLEQTARDIAIAAVKYAMLQVSGNQQIVFDFEQALSFDGRAAPYLQYAYARAGKLVESVGADLVSARDAAGGDKLPPYAITEADLHASEIALLRQLYAWPETCRAAAQRFEPAVVANYLYALADSFNAFYRDCRVLDAPEDVKPWRQALTCAFRSVMKTGFDILALPLPEAM